MGDEGAVEAADRITHTLEGAVRRSPIWYGISKMFVNRGELDALYWDPKLEPKVDPGTDEGNEVADVNELETENGRGHGIEAEVVPSSPAPFRSFLGEEEWHYEQQPEAKEQSDIDLDTDEDNSIHECTTNGCDCTSSDDSEVQEVPDVCTCHTDCSEAHEIPYVCSKPECTDCRKD
jgi:hypothetical protein